MQSNHDLVILYDILKSRFSLDGLNELCFYLGIVHENLPGETRKRQAQSLLEYCQRRALVPVLVNVIREQRPDIEFDWHEPTGFKTIIKSGRFPAREPFYALSGREDNVDDIIRVLCGATGRAGVMVVGIGGIGKTAVAVEAVRRIDQLAETPFQAITWDSAKQEIFTAGERQTVQDAVINYVALVNSLGQQLIGNSFRQQLPTERERVLTQKLQQTSTLIVVDNLETVENAEQLFTNLNRILGNGRLLLTTRHQIPNDTYQIQLTGLTETDARAFLQQEIAERNLKLVVNEGEFKRIYDATEGMPLAMKLIVGQAVMIGVEESLAQLKTVNEAEIYLFIFLETWRRLSDLARELLIYISPSTGYIELDLMVDLVNVAKKDAGVVVSETEIFAAVKKLIRFSLLTPHHLHSYPQPVYTLHQLVRYFVMNDLPNLWQSKGYVT